MNKYSALLITILILLPFVQDCSQRASSNFPNTEIVYEANKEDNPLIGFINGDGSNRIEINIGHYAELPVWSDEKKTINFFEPRGDYMILSPLTGYPYFWQDGKQVTYCKNLVGNPIYSFPNSEDILVSSVTDIRRINQQTCKEVKVYLKYDEPFNPPRVAGFSISHDGETILFAEAINSRYTIKTIDLNSDKMLDIGKGGINPEFSPDDSWIAYTGLDGIYLMRSDGTQIRRIVEGDFQDRYSDVVQFDVRPPAPRWSPDGKWLVYHKCRQPSTSSCAKIEDYSIYKVHVSDGKEIKILDGGLYPYWRLK